jgi:hypothetical protein
VVALLDVHGTQLYSFLTNFENFILR